MITIRQSTFLSALDSVSWTEQRLCLERFVCVNHNKTVNVSWENNCILKSKGHVHALVPELTSVG